MKMREDSCAVARYGTWKLDCSALFVVPQPCMHPWHTSASVLGHLNHPGALVIECQVTWVPTYIWPGSSEPRQTCLQIVLFYAISIWVNMNATKTTMQNWRHIAFVTEAEMKILRLTFGVEFSSLGGNGHLPIHLRVCERGSP
ncbi:hypothetical protein Nepgr_001643 [Nepenthes gracilis]|uniref:Uncharacterized protein n=1 Tax=Nepenthes gracilis TaxID=150966 RepID=A0AAD3P4T4_NEPGR|nr:hypothetical protein Nepgr_001643 [Nepenthes gracilis]